MEWWNGVAYPRVNPGGSIIVVQARWTDNDLAGQLIAEGGWEVINLQAIDEEGRALWPEKRDLEFLRDVEQRIGPYDWMSLYQGQPQPRGDRLMREVYTYRDDDIPEDAVPVAAIDLAYTTSSRADRSALVEGLVAGDTLYVTNLIVRQCELEDFAKDVADVRAREVMFEPGPSEATNVRYLNSLLAKENAAGRVVVRETRTVDKFTAAQPLIGLWNTQKVLLPEPPHEREDGTLETRCSYYGEEWQIEVLKEVHSFTGTGLERDDIVDALIPLSKLPNPDRRAFRGEAVDQAYDHDVQQWDLSG